MKTMFGRDRDAIVAAAAGLAAIEPTSSASSSGVARTLKNAG